MKKQISFMTSLFKTGVAKQDAVNDRLLGEELALWFISRSKDGEFTFDKPVQGRSGWSETVRSCGEEFTLGFEIVHSSVGAEYAEWNINIDKADRIGGMGSNNSEARALLCDHVYNVLRGSRDTRELQWSD